MPKPSWKTPVACSYKHGSKEFYIENRKNRIIDDYNNLHMIRLYILISDSMDFLSSFLATTVATGNMIDTTTLRTSPLECTTIEQSIDEAWHDPLLNELGKFNYYTDHDIQQLERNNPGTTVNNFPLEDRYIYNICYGDKNHLIVIAGSDYLKRGFLFKYDIATSHLEMATDKLGYLSMSLMDVLRNQNGEIIIRSAFGDGGIYNENFARYNLLRNTIYKPFATCNKDITSENGNDTTISCSWIPRDTM